MSLKLFIILNFLYQYNVFHLTSAVARNRGRTYYSVNNDYNRDLFNQFKAKYKKYYSSATENEQRFRIFKKNLKIIDEKNMNSDGVYFGITEFADKTIQEFWARNTGFNEDDLPKNDSHYAPYRYKLSGKKPMITNSLDWRRFNIVDTPRHQGECSSCWSFSAAGVVFGQLARFQKKRVTLSTQQLVDCFAQGGGCKTGSFPHLAIQHAAQNGGIMTEYTYPYKGAQGNCRFRKDKAIVQLKKGVIRKIKDEEALKSLVHDYGPVSVGVHANQGFVFYTGGIANARTLQCNSSMKINHAVLLVGYGEENGIPYWIIQNSAGELWGEGGFIRMVRGRNTCNILTYVATAELQ